MCAGAFSAALLRPQSGVGIGGQPCLFPVTLMDQALPLPRHPAEPGQGNLTMCEVSEPQQKRFPESTDFLKSVIKSVSN